MKPQINCGTFLRNCKATMLIKFVPMKNKFPRRVLKKWREGLKSKQLCFTV